MAHLDYQEYGICDFCGKYRRVWEITMAPIAGASACADCMEAPAGGLSPQEAPTP